MGISQAAAMTIGIAFAGCAAGDLSDPSDAADGARDVADGPVAPDARSVPNGVLLPLAVDDYFIPSGYMGDGETGGIARAETCASPRPGDARGLCHEFTWTPGALGWAGVFWQFPEGNWGAQPGLAIEPGATGVSFWAWGAEGGELVTFLAGMSDVDGFSQELFDVALTTTPTRYTIALGGVAYADVTGGFAWVANTALGADSRFYLDDLQWH